MSAIQEETFNGYKIQIYQDENPMNPRENDNLGKMACFHNRYVLGDKHNMSIDDVKTIADDEMFISLPLYLYDHSGITMNTTGFSCPWDSGQVGIIFVSKEQARKEYGWKNITKTRYRLIETYLENEVITYDDYLRGNAYGFTVKGPGGDDSCWGFLGDIDYCLQEARESASYLYNEQVRLASECGV